MIDISVDYKVFNISSLIDKTIDFSKNNYSPYFAIPWIYEANDSPVYSKNAEEEVDYDNLPDNSDRDYIDELVNERKLLFFTFSTNNVGDPVKCADGKEYIMDDESDDDYTLGDTECLGFLLEYENEKLRIRTALNFSGACMIPSSISIHDELGVLEKPMKDYIDSFIKA